jgi:hypothetical protein
LVSADLKSKPLVSVGLASGLTVFGGVSPHPVEALGC